jgi:carbonic anhydrase|tara:strand:+ start:3036 stop:3566 length:531 start_codon:yes stop_codon:yes gene_type:complete
MSKILKEVIFSNEKYAKNFNKKGDLQAAPIKKFAILTCMDARLDPAKFAGLSEGDAHVIRNAGGRVSDDAIRSLLISYKLLGTKEWFVIHHTDCGLEKFTNGDIDKEFNLDSKNKIDWLTFNDNEKSVVDDVLKLKNHSLVPNSIQIYGYIYDCKTGNLKEVYEATKVGAKLNSST